MLVIKVHSGSSRNLPNSQMMKKRTKFLCSKSNGDFPGGPVGKTPRSQAGGLGSILVRGTISHMPQLRVCMLGLSPRAATKKAPCCN